MLEAKARMAQRTFRLILEKRKKKRRPHGVSQRDVTTASATYGRGRINMHPRMYKRANAMTAHRTFRFTFENRSTEKKAHAARYRIRLKALPT